MIDSKKKTNEFWRPAGTNSNNSRHDIFPFIFYHSHEHMKKKFETLKKDGKLHTCLIERKLYTNP